MSSHAFGAFIDIEPSSTKDEAHTAPAAPAKAFPRVYHSGPDPTELENLQWDTRLNGPSQPSQPGSGTQTPREPADLEMSGPPTPTNEHEVDALQSFSYPPMNRYRMLSVCLMNFGNGLSDASSGALIPYMETHYHIGYAIVSLIFVTNAMGFISAAFFVDAIRARLGRARTLIVAQSLMTCGYIPIVCTPPWPVVIVCFFFLGFGMAINLAMGNVFAANLHNGTKMLGAMHGSYGIGGTIGPLVATAMVTKGELLWSRYYFLPLSTTLFNGFLAAWSFWRYEAEAGMSLLTPLEIIASRRQNNGTGGAEPKAQIKEQLASMLQSFKSKTVILGALFIFAYQGAEVSISGWVISFLISARHGDPASVGYVTSGFWAGITLGRFFLSHPAHKIGEKLFVYGMVLGAVVFELLVWLVPNVIGNAVAVSIVGLLLGPVYPCATVIFSRAIGRKEQVSSLSVISAFGSSGGALAPFTTGILAQAAGTFVLHPICIGLFTVMLGCWFVLPTPKKRSTE